MRPGIETNESLGLSDPNLLLGMSEGWRTLFLAWETFSDVAWALLPLAAIMALPWLLEKQGARFLGRFQWLLFLAAWMAWSLWLWPIGLRAWTFYLEYFEGIFCFYSPDPVQFRGAYPFSLMIAVPVAMAHTWWMAAQPERRLRGKRAGLFATIPFMALLFLMKSVIDTWALMLTA